MGIAASAKVVAIVCTTNRERAKAFYHVILGFNLSHEDDFAVSDLNGTMLRVSAVPNQTANVRHIRSLSTVR